MTLEQRGIPTATVITHAFRNSAYTLRRMRGLETLPIIVIPHPLAARDAEEVRRKARDAFPDLIEALGQSR